ncbi:MAG: transposase [Planctomycetes bacterium]|nr:transposase [Planctomycetota bacterium]
MREIYNKVRRGDTKRSKVAIVAVARQLLVRCRAILRAGGIRCVKTTVASPNLNPFVEWFVRSIKSECMDKVLIFAESHLRYCVNEYIEHYHAERPHQGIGNNIIEPLQAKFS